MDNGKAFVVKEQKTKYDGTDYDISSSTETSLVVNGIGSFEKESDSVMVCNNIPYFRNGGTNLEYKLKVVGFTASRAASTTGLSGIKGKGKSKTYKSFVSNAESDANGEITFNAPTINDVQTVTIENNGKNVVISNLKIQNSGDFMGTAALVNADEYNLKITGVIAEEDKHNGYLYGNNAKEYPMTITITNISDVVCSTSICQIEADDPNLTLSSTQNLAGITISTLPKGGTKEIQITASYGNLEDSYVDTGIKITIVNPFTEQEWSDYIPLRFYKGTIPIAISAKSPERNEQAALNGFVIYPDGNNQFFAINENSSDVIYVPTFGADKKYKMIFSGATVTSELSESTEMYYTVAAGSKTPKAVVTDASAQELVQYITFGGSNHNENTAYVVNEDFEAYLREGEIDYYEITADTEEFYSPEGSGYYLVSYESEYDESSLPETFIVPDGSVLTASQLPELSQEYMTHDGWYVGSTKVNAGSYTVRDSIVLTAHWSYTDYPVTYNLNGGTNAASNVATYTVNDEVTLADPSRDYCEFAGWYDNEDFNGTAVTGITAGSSGAKIFYAKWNPTEYTITYVLDDKGTNAAANPSTYNIDTDDIILAPAASDDYGFGGWFTTSTFTGTQTAKIEKGSHGDITLYARWAEKRNVTYESDHGTQPEAIVVAEGTVLSDVQISDLTDADYFFKGWYTEETYTNKVEADAYTVGSDVTLYAKWVKKCRITYVSEYEQPETVVLEEGKALTSAELPGIHTEGYVLKGWYTEAAYENRISNGYTITGDMILYAFWEESSDGFVFVEGGAFEMGDSTTQSVILSNFYMSPYELTQKIYTEIMGENPSSFVSVPAEGEIQEERPVEYVSWFDAIYFCNKYSEAAGFTPCYSVDGNTDVTMWAYIPHNGKSISGTITCDLTADGYRLPTEAEWEYAARGGINKDFYLYSGSDIADEVAWYTLNSDSKTHQVGKKIPNSLGLYDMSGNVSEWCLDWYGSYSSTVQIDPVGEESGSNRVIRGGGWSDSESFVSCTIRNYSIPRAVKKAKTSTRKNDKGFRVVRSVN